MHENDHDCKEGGCKHEVTSPGGELSSPHYPDYYPAKKDCVWLFTTTPGHRIKLVNLSINIFVLVSKDFQKHLNFLANNVIFIS